MEKLCFDSILVGRNEDKIPDVLFEEELFLGVGNHFEGEGFGKQGMDFILFDTRDEGGKNRFVPGGASNELEVFEVEGSCVE